VKYIDHYEIDYKYHGGKWEPVGSVYPHYQWRIIRPWFFLWLICWPKIVNNAKAAALRARCQATDAALALIGGDKRDHIRIWRWVRKGQKLTKHIDSQFDGYMI
jgi:hypothetical protein